jgi:uncharacterized membrane protein
MLVGQVMLARQVTPALLEIRVMLVIRELALAVGLAAQEAAFNLLTHVKFCQSKKQALRRLALAVLVAEAQQGVILMLSPVVILSPMVIREL